MKMTKELALEIEKFLYNRLLPEYGFILVYGEPGKEDTGIISNYGGENVVRILKTLAHVAYSADPGDNN
jgi:hypothetical protein